MAQTFTSEIEWLAALKCRATGSSTSLFLMKPMCSANLSDRRWSVSPMSKQLQPTTFTARDAVNDVEGGACKIVPNNKIGFTNVGLGCRIQ